MTGIGLVCILPDLADLAFSALSVVANAIIQTIHIKIK